MKLNVELSRRETEVAHLLAWGASKKEVADILFISTRTVEKYSPEHLRESRHTKGYGTLRLVVLYKA